MKKFFLYLFRWQLSTPILWLVVRNLGAGIEATIIANLIGGAIFFWIDKFIFQSNNFEVWYLKKGKCHKCGQKGPIRRLVKTANYDRTKAKAIFLCKKCSQQKIIQLKQNGVKVSSNLPTYN